MVSNYDELNRAMTTASDSENASLQQVMKTMDSIETKAQQVKTAFTDLYAGGGYEEEIKTILDTLTTGLKNIKKQGLSTILSLIAEVKNVLQFGPQNLLNMMSNGVYMQANSPKLANWGHVGNDNSTPPPTALPTAPAPTRVNTAAAADTGAGVHVRIRGGAFGFGGFGDNGSYTIQQASEVTVAASNAVTLTNVQIVLPTDIFTDLYTNLSDLHIGVGTITTSTIETTTSTSATQAVNTASTAASADQLHADAQQIHKDTVKELDTKTLDDGQTANGTIIKGRTAPFGAGSGLRPKVLLPLFDALQSRVGFKTDEEYAQYKADYAKKHGLTMEQLEEMFKLPTHLTAALNPDAPLADRASQAEQMSNFLIANEQLISQMKAMGMDLEQMAKQKGRPFNLYDELTAIRGGGSKYHTGKDWGVGGYVTYGPQETPETGITPGMFGDLASYLMTATSAQFLSHVGGLNGAAVGVHELGHAFMRTNDIEADSDTALSRELKEYYTDLVASDFGDKKGIFGHGLSSYGGKNFEEFLAEAFSEAVLYENPREMANTVAEIIFKHSGFDIRKLTLGRFGNGFSTSASTEVEGRIGRIADKGSLSVQGAIQREQKKAGVYTPQVTSHESVSYDDIWRLLYTIGQTKIQMGQYGSPKDADLTNALQKLLTSMYGISADAAPKWATDIMSLYKKDNNKDAAHPRGYEGREEQQLVAQWLFEKRYLNNPDASIEDIQSLFRELPRNILLPKDSTEKTMEQGMTFAEFLKVFPQFRYSALFQGDTDIHAAQPLSTNEGKGRGYISHYLKPTNLLNTKFVEGMGALDSLTSADFLRAIFDGRHTQYIGDFGQRIDEFGTAPREAIGKQLGSLGTIDYLGDALQDIVKNAFINSDTGEVLNSEALERYEQLRDKLTDSQQKGLLSSDADKQAYVEDIRALIQTVFTGMKSTGLTFADKTLNNLPDLSGADWQTQVAEWLQHYINLNTGNAPLLYHYVQPTTESVPTPPPEEKKKQTPPEEEKKNPPEEKKQTPPTPAPEKQKETPPPEEEKKKNPPEKQTPPEEEKKKQTPPEEKKQTPPEKKEQKQTPPPEEKKQTPPSEDTHEVSQEVMRASEAVLTFCKNNNIEVGQLDDSLVRKIYRGEETYIQHYTGLVGAGRSQAGGNFVGVTGQDENGKNIYGTITSTGAEAVPLDRYIDIESLPELLKQLGRDALTYFGAAAEKYEVDENGRRTGRKVLNHGVNIALDREGILALDSQGRTTSVRAEDLKFSYTTRSSETSYGYHGVDTAKRPVETITNNENGTFLRHRVVDPAYYGGSIARQIQSDTAVQEAYAQVMAIAPEEWVDLQKAEKKLASAQHGRVGYEQNLRRVHAIQQGYSTAGEEFTLADGSTIVMTAEEMTDAQQRIDNNSTYYTHIRKDGLVEGQAAQNRIVASAEQQVTAAGQAYEAAAKTEEFTTALAALNDAIEQAKTRITTEAESLTANQNEINNAGNATSKAGTRGYEDVSYDAMARQFDNARLDARNLMGINGGLQAAITDMHAAIASPSTPEPGETPPQTPPPSGDQGKTITINTVVKLIITTVQTITKMIVSLIAKLTAQTIQTMVVHTASSVIINGNGDGGNGSGEGPLEIEIDAGADAQAEGKVRVSSGGQQRTYTPNPNLPVFRDNGDEEPEQATNSKMGLPSMARAVMSITQGISQIGGLIQTIVGLISEDKSSDDVETSKVTSGLGQAVNGLGSAVGGIGSALSTIAYMGGAATLGPVGWIAVLGQVVPQLISAFIPLIQGFVTLFDGLDYTNAEKYVNALAEQQEAQDDATEATAKSTDLASQLSKIQELQKTAYSSEESLEEYQSALNNLADTYPTLITQYDASGNAILDLTSAEQALYQLRLAEAKTNRQLAAAKMTTNATEQATLNDILTGVNQNVILREAALISDNLDVSGQLSASSIIDAIAATAGGSLSFSGLDVTSQSLENALTYLQGMSASTILTTYTGKDGEQLLTPTEADSLAAWASAFADSGSLNLDTYLNNDSAAALLTTMFGPTDRSKATSTDDIVAQWSPFFTTENETIDDKALAKALRSVLTDNVITALEKADLTLPQDFFAEGDDWATEGINVEEYEQYIEYIETSLNYVKENTTAVLQTYAEAIAQDTAIVWDASKDTTISELIATTSDTYSLAWNVLRATWEDRAEQAKIDVDSLEDLYNDHSSTFDSWMEQISTELLNSMYSYTQGMSTAQATTFIEDMSNMSQYGNVEQFYSAHQLAVPTDTTDAFYQAIYQEWLNDRNTTLQRGLQMIYNPDLIRVNSVSGRLEVNRGTDENGATVWSDEFTDNDWQRLQQDVNSNSNFTQQQVAVITAQYQKFSGSNNQLSVDYMNDYITELNEINQVMKEGYTLTAQARLEELNKLYDTLQSSNMTATVRNAYSATLTALDYASATDIQEVIDQMEADMTDSTKSYSSADKAAMNDVIDALEEMRDSIAQNVVTTCQTWTDAISTFNEKITTVLSNTTSGMDFASALEAFNTLQADSTNAGKTFEDFFTYDEALNKWVYSTEGFTAAQKNAAKKLNTSANTAKIAQDASQEIAAMYTTIPDSLKTTWASLKKLNFSDSLITSIQNTIQDEFGKTLSSQAQQELQQYIIDYYNADESTQALGLETYIKNKLDLADAAYEAAISEAAAQQKTQTISMINSVDWASLYAGTATDATKTILTQLIKQSNALLDDATIQQIVEKGDWSQSDYDYLIKELGVEGDIDAVTARGSQISTLSSSYGTAITELLSGSGTVLSQTTRDILTKNGITISMNSTTGQLTVQRAADAVNAAQELMTTIGDSFASLSEKLESQKAIYDAAYSTTQGISGALTTTFDSSALEELSTALGVSLFDAFDASTKTWSHGFEQFFTTDAFGNTLLTNVDFSVFTQAMVDYVNSTITDETKHINYNDLVNDNDYQEAYADAVDAVIKNTDELELAAVEQMQDFAKVGIGDTGNLSRINQQVANKLGDGATEEDVAKKLAEYGIVIQNGVAQMTADVDLGGLADWLYDENVSAALRNEMAQLNDALLEVMQDYTSILKGGLTGNMSNDDLDTITSRFPGLEDADYYTRTAEGWQLTMSGIIAASAALREYNSLQYETWLEEAGSQLSTQDGWHNSIEILHQIVSLQALVAAEDAKANTARADEYREELELAQDIYNYRSRTDSTTFDFFGDQNLSTAEKAIQQAFSSYKEGIDALNDAVGKGSSSTATGGVDMATWSGLINMMTDDQATAFAEKYNLTTTKIVDGVAQDNQKITSAADLVALGYKYLGTALDGSGSDIVSFSKLFGNNMSSAVSDLTSNTDDYIDELAQSQIDIIDAQINMIEGVLAIQDLDMDKSGTINLNDMFEWDESDGTETITKITDAFTENSQAILDAFNNNGLFTALDEKIKLGKNQTGLGKILQSVFGFDENTTTEELLKETGFDKLEDLSSAIEPYLTALFSIDDWGDVTGSDIVTVLGTAFDKLGLAFSQDANGNFVITTKVEDDGTDDENLTELQENSVQLEEVKTALDELTPAVKEVANALNQGYLTTSDATGQTLFNNWQDALEQYQKSDNSADLEKLHENYGRFIAYLQSQGYKTDIYDEMHLMDTATEGADTSDENGDSGDNNNDDTDDSATLTDIGKDTAGMHDLLKKGITVYVSEQSTEEKAAEEEKAKAAAEEAEKQAQEQEDIEVSKREKARLAHETALATEAAEAREAELHTERQEQIAQEIKDSEKEKKLFEERCEAAQAEAEAKAAAEEKAAALHIKQQEQIAEDIRNLEKAKIKFEDNYEANTPNITMGQGTGRNMDKYNTSAYTDLGANEIENDSGLNVVSDEEDALAIAYALNGQGASSTKLRPRDYIRSNFVPVGTSLDEATAAAINEINYVPLVEGLMHSLTEAGKEAFLATAESSQFDATNPNDASYFTSLLQFMMSNNGGNNNYFRSKESVSAEVEGYNQVAVLQDTEITAGNEKLAASLNEAKAQIVTFAQNILAGNAVEEEDIAQYQANVELLSGYNTELDTSLSALSTSLATYSPSLQTMSVSSSGVTSIAQASSISVTGSTVNVSGGSAAADTTSTTSNDAGRGVAKGNVALAKGTGTLMGELGPEMVVSNGHYFVAGQNGAEFVDLPEDAIVFNHQQTASLMATGHTGRGKAVNGDAAAIAMARGNWNGGEAHASASDTLSKLYELRAMWQNLLDSKGSDLASKSSGGSDSTVKSVLKDLERWYNLLRQIDKEEAQISYEQKKRENMTNGSDYVKSLREELALLQEEEKTYERLAEAQKSYYDAKRNELNNSAYSMFYTYDEDGLMQYNNENYHILEEIYATDENGKAKLNADQQIAKLKEYGFDTSKLDYSSEGEKSKTNEDRMNVFKDQFDAYQEELDDIYDSYHEYQEKVEDALSEQTKIMEEYQQIQIDTENLVLEAIEDMKQAEIDKMQDQYDLLNDTSKDYIDGLSDALSKEKELYEQSEDSQELTQLQRQLAVLQRSGGSASAIKSLQDQIDSQLQDQYFTERQNEIDAIQDASDKQLEKLQEQIDIATETLEYQKDNGLLWQDVDDKLTSGSPEAIQAFLQQYSSTYQNLSATGTAKQMADDLKLIQEYVELMSDNGSGFSEWYSSADLKSEISKVTNGSTAWEAAGDDLVEKVAQEAYVESLNSGSTKAQAQTAATEAVYKYLQLDKDTVAKTATKNGSSTSSSKSSSNKSSTTNTNDGTYSWYTSDGKSVNYAVTSYAKQHSAKGYTIATKKNDTAPSVESLKDTGSTNTTTDISTAKAAALAEKEAAKKAYDQACAASKQAQEALANKVTLEQYYKDTNATTTSARTKAKAAWELYVANLQKAVDNAVSKVNSTKAAYQAAIQKYNSYHDGGDVDYTGLAMVHGSKSHPEAFISADDRELMKSSIFSGNAQNVVAAFEQFTKFAEKIATNYDDDSTNNKGMNIENISINLDSGLISDDYDAQRAAQTVMDEIVKIARQSGNISLSGR